MAFLITTTGSVPSVIFYDLGERTFAHPTTNYNLEDEFTIDEIRYSDDVFASISAGELTATYNGKAVTQQSDLDSVRADDNRLYTLHEIRVKKNPGQGEFSSIAAAIASVTGNTPTNQFKIIVGPGTYVEPTIVMKSYVSLMGAGLVATTIVASNPNNKIIVGANASRVSMVSLNGATGTSGRAVYFDGAGVTPSSFLVENCLFGNNYIQYEHDAQQASVASVVKQCFILGSASFNTAILVKSNGNSSICLFSGIEYNRSISPYSNLIFDIRDSGSFVRVENSSIVGAENALHLSNGAQVYVSNTLMKGATSAIRSLDSSPSVPAFLEIKSVSFSGCTMNVSIENPLTEGHLEGYTEIEKISIPDGSSFFISNKDINTIYVAKKGGDFDSISEAVNFITDSSEAKRYIIQIGPGLFTEPEIDLTGKPYVSLVGSTIQATVIMPDADNHHVIKQGAKTEISFLTIKNAGSGYAAIAYIDQGDYGQCHKVSVFDCDICLLVESVTQDTFYYAEYVDFNGAYTYGVKTIANNNYIAFANLENYYNFPTIVMSPDTCPVGTFVSGTGAEVKVLASGHDTTSMGNSPLGGTCFYAEDGASISIAASEINGWRYGIKIANAGAPSSIDVLSADTAQNTYDIYIDHPGGTGSFQGQADMSGVYIDPLADFNILIQGEDDGALNISKSLNIRFANGTQADVSTLIIESGTMGIMEGGGLSAVGSPAFDVLIAEGFGYLEQFPDTDYLKRIDWPDTILTLAPNTVNYIFWNYNGILTVASSPPDTFFNILLGRVVTNSDGIEFVDDSGLEGEHTGNRLSTTLRHAFGSVFVSGSIVSENATPLHLDVTQGHYHFAENIFHPSGGSDIDFLSFYRDGSGGFVRTSTNAVDNTSYDDGSGTLQPLTAGYYAKHSLYVIGQGANERYFLVHSQEQFSALALAQQGDIPLPPSYFEEGVVLIAGIIVQQGASNIVEIHDLRPIIGFRAPTVSATTFHGNLLGLTADDHPQYIPVDGSRAFTGNIDLGGNSITNVNLVDGVNIELHGSRHLPNGLDPLATGVPSTIGTTNSTGIANAFARQDHVHAHGAQTDGSLHAVATTSVAGFLSASDKTKLDSVSSGASVSSVSLSMPASVFSVAGSPVTSSGTLAVTYLTQSANTIFAGPSAGGAAVPAFRTLVKADQFSTTVYTDQANTFGDFSQVFRSSRLQLTNPANTQNYTFVGSAIAAGRNITIPLLTADDTFVFANFIQTLTNKTLDNTNAVTLKDTLFVLQDDADTTKQLQLQLSGITTATTRTLTVPDISGTILTRDNSIRNTASTTNNTPTTILTIPIVNGTAYMMELWVTSRKTGGGGVGSVGDSNAYERMFKVKRAGAVTLGTVQSSYTDEDIAAHDVTVSVSGTNILVQVTGSANNNVNWVAQVEIMTLQ